RDQIGRDLLVIYFAQAEEAVARLAAAVDQGKDQPGQLRLIAVRDPVGREVQEPGATKNLQHPLTGGVEVGQHRVARRREGGDALCIEKGDGKPGVSTAAYCQADVWG